MFLFVWVVLVLIDVPLLILLLGVMTLPHGLFGSWWEELVAVLLALSLVPLMATGLLGPLTVVVLPPSQPRGGVVCHLCVGFASVFYLLCCVLSVIKKFGMSPRARGFVCLFVLFPAVVVCFCLWFAECLCLVLPSFDLYC